MDYIYGKLNLEVKKVEYSGVDTTTARTTVVTSDEANEIYVDVLLNVDGYLEDGKGIMFGATDTWLGISNFDDALTYRYLLNLAGIQLYNEEAHSETHYNNFIKFDGIGITEPTKEALVLHSDEEIVFDAKRYTFADTGGITVKSLIIGGYRDEGYFIDFPGGTLGINNDDDFLQFDGNFRVGHTIETEGLTAKNPARTGRVDTDRLFVDGGQGEHIGNLFQVDGDGVRMYNTDTDDIIFQVLNGEDFIDMPGRLFVDGKELFVPFSKSIHLGTKSGNINLAAYNGYKIDIVINGASELINIPDFCSISVTMDGDQLTIRLPYMINDFDATTPVILFGKELLLNSGGSGAYETLNIEKLPNIIIGSVSQP